MAKEKVTITLDRRKADAARALVGARSTSEVIEMALDHLIRDQRLRRDIEAYRRIPPTDEELAIAEASEHPQLDDDDTDWEALYPSKTE